MSEKEILTLNEKYVQERLDNAARTLRRMPSAKVQGYFSTWPEIRREKAELQQMEAVLRLGPPSAKDISQMDEVLFTWLKWLHAEERKLVWLRAERTRWKQVCWIIGCNRTTAWRKYKMALLKIAARLK